MITAKVLGILPLTYDRPRYRAGGSRGSFLCDPAWRAENLLPFGQTPAQYRAELRTQARAKPTMSLAEQHRYWASRYKPDPPRVRALRRPRGDGLPDIRTPAEIQAETRRREEARAAASRSLSQMRQYQRPARQYRSSLRESIRMSERIRAERHAKYLAREAYKREVAARVQAAKAAGRARAAPRKVVTPVAPPMVMLPHTTLSARLAPGQLTAETQRILLEPPPEIAAERRERLENIRRRLGIFSDQ